jgi:DNA-binding Lrp family transcriptional regulator
MRRIANARPASAASRPLQLDQIDRQILAILRENGRITYTALAELVGLTTRPCLERVRRLESRGILRGYGARIDPGMAGHAVIALAGIALREPSAATRQKVERSLVANPAVVELTIVNGDFDYLARVVAPSLEAYELLTHDYLADPAFGIGRIHTTFVLKTIKEFQGYPLTSDEI